MARRVLKGKVVSDKMDKTITVLVERRYMHSLYKKFIKRSDKFAAHDENNQHKVGDLVAIEECKPISKRKTWTVITDEQANTKAPAKKPAAKKAPSKKAPAKVDAKVDAKKAAPAAKPAAKKETAKKAPAKKTTTKKTTAKKTTAKKDDK
jgi:small subunit ribosomal protein S17